MASIDGSWQRISSFFAHKHKENHGQNNGFEIRNTFPEVDFRNFCKRCKMSKMELFHYLNEIELKFMTASEEETEYKPEKMKISIDFQVKRKQDIKESTNFSLDLLGTKYGNMAAAIETKADTLSVWYKNSSDKAKFIAVGQNFEAEAEFGANKMRLTIYEKRKLESLVMHFRKN